MPRHNRSLRLRSVPPRRMPDRRSDHQPATPAAEPIASDTIPEPAASETAVRAPLPAHRSSASAVSKLILCGEHAVVYGRPAIALPLAGIRARADVTDSPAGSGIAVHARDLRRRWLVANDPHGPISQLIASALSYLQQQATAPLDLGISISSTIPIASGMGSGAAVATAIVRALAAHLGRQLEPAEISSLVYASEQRFHGMPSGIDNTVIAYEQPIWFQRMGIRDRGLGIGNEPSQPPTPSPQPPTIEPIIISIPLTLLIADTGVRSATRLPVGEVRRRWQADPARFEALFDQVGEVVTHVRSALQQGNLPALGQLLSQNHALLQKVGVSSPELDTLVLAAQRAGALGAKLSGAGWGGIMLALVTPDTRALVAAALDQAGARRVSATIVNASRPASAAL